jgi:murein DD-endopeptidase MepM/ murein hydrolase activator NlpD
MLSWKTLFGKLPSELCRFRLTPRSPSLFAAAHCRIILLGTILLAAFQVATAGDALANDTPAVPKGSVKSSWSVQWQPAQLVNGAPIVFQVVPPTRLTSLSGKWLDHEVFFAYEPATKKWYGIAGISLETHPGVYALELKGTTSRGSEISFSRTFTIRSARYPSIAVTVAKQFTEPSHEQLERIQQDKTVKQDVFHHTSPDREWSGKFRAPVDASISDVFGTQRTFNGRVQSMHQGLDFAVPKGTPVFAANAGTVLLASPLYFEGNCVVIDHGQGLLTLYLHLSEIKVKAGDRVESGQELGLSGGTGRATGPHLHMAVRWEGVYLNPATLLTLKLP